uniref:Uncharacterized protein n=1 Tax=Solanum lycopersicum TaxID=4081 RepID=A0A3Q7JLC7_SOLLC
MARSLACDGRPTTACDPDGGGVGGDGGGATSSCCCVTLWYANHYCCRPANAGGFDHLPSVGEDRMRWYDRGRVLWAPTGRWIGGGFNDIGVRDSYI